MRTYEFTRLVNRLETILPSALAPEADVLWQMGATTVRPRFGRVEASVPSADLRAAIGAADLVVAHAGIGSAITALETGRRPVLVPRRSAYNEHVDDHQELIARELGNRGLSVSREVDELTEDDLWTAARGRVIEPSAPGPFPLIET